METESETGTEPIRIRSIIKEPRGVVEKIRSLKHNKKLQFKECLQELLAICPHPPSEGHIMVFVFTEGNESVVAKFKLEDIT